MPKVDDDDDDSFEGKNAYEENGRLVGEEACEVSAVIAAFCHFVTASRFRKELDTFFDAHCLGFEEASSEGEQRLEWTAVYEEFLALIERELETFCACHQVTASSVFAAARRACESGTLDDEFLPSILAVTEYTYFIEQMSLTARQDDFLRRAAILGGLSSEEKDDDHSENVSGIWRIATKDAKGHELTDTKGGLEKYLRAVGVPKSLRGLFKGSLFSTRGLVLLQDNESLTIIADTIAGRHERKHLLDGKVRHLTNPRGTPSPWRATFDMGRITLTNDKPSGLPRGSRIITTYETQQNFSKKRGKLLKCTSQVERPTGLVTHEFFYAQQNNRGGQIKQPTSPHRRDHK